MYTILMSSSSATMVCPSPLISQTLEDYIIYFLMTSIVGILAYVIRSIPLTMNDYTFPENKELGDRVQIWLNWFYYGCAILLVTVSLFVVVALFFDQFVDMARQMMIVSTRIVMDSVSSYI